MKMDNWLVKAMDKLDAEKAKVTGQKEKVMAPVVLKAIKDFCRQEPEFAQAVAQGGAFADCMRQIAAGTGNAISDLDVYKKAVQYYFPGAKVQMQLTIDLIGDAAKHRESREISSVAAPSKKPVMLNLEDFF